MNRPDFTINGLHVQTQKIADGMYEIICEQGDDHIVAFGMIPMWVITTLETQIRERAIAESARQLGCTVEELTPFLDEQKIRDIVQPIIHEITIGIYDAAARAGKLRV